MTIIMPIASLPLLPLINEHGIAVGGVIVGPHILPPPPLAALGLRLGRLDCLPGAFLRQSRGRAPAALASTSPSALTAASPTTLAFFAALAAASLPSTDYPSHLLTASRTPP
jgi:hypothetical protein